MLTRNHEIKHVLPGNVLVTPAQEHARSSGLVGRDGVAEGGGRLEYRHMTAEDLHSEGKRDCV